jgi:hypothetical protein
MKEVHFRDLRRIKNYCTDDQGYPERCPDLQKQWNIGRPSLVGFFSTDCDDVATPPLMRPPKADVKVVLAKSMYAAPERHPEICR